MPHLVVVCGLPGVGKSTIARDVAPELDAELCRTDAFRKQLRADPRYDREETRLVYARLLDTARELLADGNDVVLDGTFRRKRHRTWANDLADAVRADFEVVRVVCDESVAVERLRNRDLDQTVSDASLGAYYELMQSFEELDVPHVRIDNSRSREATQRQVEEWCAQAFST